MKDYCTQNEGDCDTCSLVNYGRDCRNEPMGRLTEARFRLLMGAARAVGGQDERPNRTDYWAGYQRGLRRQYHGERFGTLEEHNLWLAAVDSPDPGRAARGQGYRDGLEAR